MRRLFLLWSCVSVILLLAATLVYACGDKLLVLNRGLRFQDFSRSRPASILLYTHTGSRASDAINDGRLQSALVKAGHKLQTVGERGRLDDALKTDHYDLVLVDLSDAPGVEESLRAAPSPPVVVPVVYEGPKQKLRRSKSTTAACSRLPTKVGTTSMPLTGPWTKKPNEI